ncbi:MAG: RNA polymerase sigma factor RpoD/SigA [bacterium]|nr:RNA polymerase sigma factor RpoD/SigA [bacterium]
METIRRHSDRDETPFSNDEEEIHVTPHVKKRRTKKESMGSSEGSGNIIKIYLRDAARKPLLTREGEFEIGKRLEEGRAGVIEIFISHALFLEKLCELTTEYLMERYGDRPEKETEKNLRAAKLAVRQHQSNPQNTALKMTAAEYVTKLELPISFLKDIRKVLQEAVAKREKNANRSRRALQKSARLVLKKSDVHFMKIEAAKCDMVEANLRLVVSIAKRYIWCKLKLPDLIQEGNIGVMKAADRWDYRRGYKFSTYATRWICQSIARSIAGQGRTIRVPVHQIDSLNRLRRVRRALYQELERAPSEAELAARLEIKVDNVKMLLGLKEPVSLDAPIGETKFNEESDPRGNFVKDTTTLPPDAELAENELAANVRKLLGRLSEKEKTVLSLRHGIDCEPHTLEETGYKLGFTRERARQIQVKALRKLRQHAIISNLKIHLRS